MFPLDSKDTRNLPHTRGIGFLGNMKNRFKTYIRCKNEFNSSMCDLLIKYFLYKPISLNIVNIDFDVLLTFLFELMPQK